jgi:hypothetical protein
MTATEKMQKLLEGLAAGKTVYIANTLRTIKVTQRDVAKFAAINRPLFKADARSLYISTGKRYDCIDYCQVTMA